jgi:acetolactate synthase-1/2/3 large subunit
MGFALPAAIGAKRPNRVVIGDGGPSNDDTGIRNFQTKVPVKIVILNNEFLGMVRQWQQFF